MKNRITIETRARRIQDGPFPATAYYRVVLVNGVEVATLAAEVRTVAQAREVLAKGGAL